MNFMIAVTLGIFVYIILFHLKLLLDYKTIVARNLFPKGNRKAKFINFFSIRFLHFGRKDDSQKKAAYSFVGLSPDLSRGLVGLMTIVPDQSPS